MARALRFSQPSEVLDLAPLRRFAAETVRMAETLDTAQREQTLQIGEVRLQSLSGGSGEPVLLLHDIDSVNEWQPFEDILAQDFALTVPSHPGFGASELPAGFDSIDDLSYLYL